MNRFTTSRKIRTSQYKNKIQVALSCVILLFLWEIIALKINNDIYLPTLEQVCLSMKEIILEDRFIIDVLSTISRCILSFFMGLFSSLFLKLLLLPLRYVLPLHFAELIQTYVLKASDYSTSRFISFGVIEKFLSLILVIVNLIDQH